ncbi:MAG: ankyrin repeat domain-containing protein [Rhodobacteraceae bacterium]|nr:ankyrin repeat domain-containing protein [Paracoccaceae bacterium]
MKRTITAALAAITLTAGTGTAQAQASCNWQSGVFWRNATTARVADCIAAGANVNARLLIGTTPLHYAAGHGTPEAVRALIDAGADMAARTEDGQAPADLAEENEAVRNHPVFWELNDGRFD